MAFDDLTEKQRKLVTRAIEVLKSGDYSDQFLWRCGRSENVEISWVLVFTTKDGSTKRIDGEFMRTDLLALSYFNYMTVVKKHRDKFTCALTQKAYSEYESSQQAASEAAPAMPDLSFISSPDLRSIIGRDYREIRRCSDAEAYKATVVMCGSATEALLLDALLQDKAKALRSAKAPRDKKQKVSKDVRRWWLSDMIEVAVDVGIVDKTVAGMTEGVREYRNLIHPAVEIRKQTAPEKEEATVAQAALDLIIKSLGRKP